MVVRLTATVAGELRSELGETPRLDARTGQLLYTDITAGLVHVGVLEPGGFRLQHTFAVGGLAGPVTPLPTPGAGWLMARERDLVHLAQDGTLTPVAALEAGRPTAFNDGVADPQGRLWVGSMGRDGLAGAGRLWRVDTAGRAVPVLAGIGIANGLDFTADGRTAFFIDTPTRQVERLDLDAAGTLTGRSTVIRVDPGRGDPDGLTVDAEGCLWVALWDGWAVHRYAPTGELLAVVAVPVARPTAVALVGTELVITTCSGWLPSGWQQDQPDAGRLFRVQVPVGGPPARPYRGPLTVEMEQVAQLDTSPSSRED